MMKPSIGLNASNRFQVRNIIQVNAHLKNTHFFKQSNIWSYESNIICTIDMYWCFLWVSIPHQRNVFLVNACVTHFAFSGVDVANGRPAVALALASFADRLYNYCGGNRSVVITIVSQIRVLARRRAVFRWAFAHFDYLRRSQVVRPFRSHCSGVQRNVF